MPARGPETGRRLTFKIKWFLMNFQEAAIVEDCTLRIAKESKKDLENRVNENNLIKK